MSHVQHKAVLVTTADRDVLIKLMQQACRIGLYSYDDGSNPVDYHVAVYGEEEG